MNKNSVCIATYNGAEFIKDQLTSILAQLNSTDEIVISDDNSTDNTIEIIKSMNDKRIKIFYNDKGSRGYSKNFENSIRKSTGDLIFISDQDDVWVTNKIRIMSDYLEQFDFVVSDAEIVDGNLDLIEQSHFFLFNVKKGFWINFLKTRYIGACMAFKSEVLKKALPFPSNYNLCAYDYWLANIGELYYKVGLVNIPLIKYRRHGNNASSGGQFSKNPFWKKIAIRIYTFYFLICRIWK